MSYSPVYIELGRGVVVLELADQATVEALIMLFREGQNRACGENLKPGDVIKMDVIYRENPLPV